MDLLAVMREEQSSGLKGGIYHLTQIKLAYNSLSAQDNYKKIMDYFFPDWEA